MPTKVEMQLKEQTITKTVSIMAEKHYPDIFPQTYPKVYENVGGYQSLKTIAAHMAHAVGVLIDKPTSDAVRYGAYSQVYRPICDMIDHKMPTFFLTKEFTEALAHTEYKDKIDWTELKMPYESGVLMLPPGFVTHPVYGECGWIGWGRAKAETEFYLKSHGYGGSPIMVGEFDSFHMFTLPINHIDMSWMTLSLTAEETSDNPFPKFLTLNQFDSWVAKAECLKDQVVEMLNEEEDVQTYSQMARILFNFFQTMLARPTLLKPGTLKKRVPRKDNSVTEFWHPNFVGSEFRIRKEKLPSTDDVTVRGTNRAHWVCGHIKKQPYGPNFSLRKTIWIEPYLTGM